MAFRVRTDGTIEVDSVDEAVAVSRRLAGRVRRAASSGAAFDDQQSLPVAADGGLPGGESSADRWSRFISRIDESKRGENQKKILRTVKQRGRVPLDDLRNAIGMSSNNALTGVLAGIIKNAKAVGFSESDVLVREQKGSGAKRKVSYGVGQALLGAPIESLG